MKLCRWLLDGSEMSGERSNTLQLDSVSYQLDGRQLSCEARNSVGTTRFDYTLKVECEWWSSHDSIFFTSTCTYT